MILQALVEYYDDLAAKGEIARPGWAKVKVSYALEIDENGQLLQVIPLKDKGEEGKKAKPREMELPSIGESKGNGIKSNFCWENCSYLFGLDTKGNQVRALQCFEKAKELHLSLLSESNDPFAIAICEFFKQWDAISAKDNPIISACVDELAGVNLVFLFKGGFPKENKTIINAWQKHYGENDEESVKMRCLVTGQKVTPALIHPPISGVWDAQPTGAAIVSFNDRAYESYGRIKQQGYNAPVSKYAAFAYTTALNHLLSDKKHVKHIGDTTLVYWAQGGEPHYQDMFSRFLDGGEDENIMTDEDLDSFMKAIVQGNSVKWDGIPINPENRFYVLGIAPNAARLSIRFFLCNSFGSFVQNIKTHYENIDIASDGRRNWRNIPLWALLRETVRITPGKTPPDSLPQMSGDTLRAILTGGSYPATLYQQTQLRIKAERKISREKAAIIKAYLIRNTDKNEYKEAARMELNEDTVYQPYVLGRLFSVAETIQERASGVTTIKDKYFTSACATPAVVFPRVIDLANKHLRKMDGSIRAYYAKQLGELMGAIEESYPAHHNLYDQGVFQLGYYHQTQQRFKKKDHTENAVSQEENREEK